MEVKKSVRKKWIAADIDRLRSGTGLTMDEIARRLDVHRATLNRWSSRGQMPEDKYKRLLSILSLSPEQRIAQLREKVGMRTGIERLDAYPEKIGFGEAFRRLERYWQSEAEAGTALAMWILIPAVAEKREPTEEERDRALTVLEWGGCPKRSVLEPDAVPRGLKKTYWDILAHLAKEIRLPEHRVKDSEQAMDILNRFGGNIDENQALAELEGQLRKPRFSDVKRKR